MRRASQYNPREVKMLWSRFVHVFKDAGLLWHSINLEKLKVAPEILASFSRGKSVNSRIMNSNESAKLIAKGFIVPTDGEKCLDDIADVTRERRNIQALYFILTTSCNLKCSYCLYNASKSGSLSREVRHMDCQVASEAINLFSKETAKNDRTNPNYWEEITFYGGEPLLNYSCLKYAVGLIRAMQQKGKIWSDTGFVLNTNGILLSEPIIRFLQKERIEVHISIDGPKDIHNGVRMFRSGKGSFDSVLSALGRMKRAGVNFVPLMTITDANMDALPEFVGWLCQEFATKSYGLNLLMHTQGEVDSSYGERAARAMLKTHAIANSFGATDKMYEGASRIFSSGRVSQQSCGAGRKLVVFPNGGIHACQALEGSGITAIGKLPIFEPDCVNRVHWSQRNRFNNPECLDCPAIGGCGGGCGASAYNSSYDVHGIDPNHCGWMKAIFKRWLEDTCK